MQYHLVGVTSTIELFECLVPAMKPAMNLNICQCISLVRTATYQISFCASAEAELHTSRRFALEPPKRAPESAMSRLGVIVIHGSVELGLAHAPQQSGHVGHFTSN